MSRSARVADIMTRDPVTIGEDATVLDAARLMSERGVGSLPVVTAGRLVGIVTETDLISEDLRFDYPTYIHLLDGLIVYPPTNAALQDAASKRVGDVMVRHPIVIAPDADAADAASVLVERGIGRLPVVDEGMLVGMLTKHDLVRLLAEEES